MKRFEATLEPVPHGGLFVVVPDAVAKAVGMVHASRVRGTVEGAPFRSGAMKYSGIFHVGIHKATASEADVRAGDRVRVAIELDPEPLPTDTVPPDLEKALRKSPAARAAFARLSPAHKREHVKHVIEAKKPETRARRIAAAVAALTAKGD